MATINQIKQLAEADTPLLFFECSLPSGVVERWSTHAISFGGQEYSARILKHNLFDLQLSADDAMDGITQLSVVVANADSRLSELRDAPGNNGFRGFKGTQLTVYFAFADLPSGTLTTESTVLFRGIAGDPETTTEDSVSLSFTNKLGLQRVPVPEVRIQRSCPWNFPSTLNQRTDAKNGGTYSRFFRCGYSADVPSGVGNLDGGQPYTFCDKSRTQCQERGMFDSDSAGNPTRRFGGFEFVPSAIMVRTSGDKTSHLSPLIDNSAKYNDCVPIVYGTGWLKAPVIFARNDGNLTHMEVLLGMGPVQGVLKVVVNGIEIPLGVSGQDMTATGWYTVFTTGGQQGNFNADFADSGGKPIGDPYGSMAAALIVVPNRISSGKSLPNVEVLLQGMRINVYNPDGSYQVTHSENPAWVILDILRRCGWSTSDLDLRTFATSAAFCQELIDTTDLNGHETQVWRSKCNLILTKRQSAAAIVRGIRVASSLMLRYGATGLLELLPERALAKQHPSLPDGGNSTEALNNGWPAYEFSDGSGPFSGIIRNPDGTSSVRLTSRSISETSNRLSVEFQDESNEYQQDSLSLVDSDDSALIGYEISSQSTASGIANFNQATRVLLRQLDKSTKGNLYVEFQTSFRAFKVRPGDIVALTYLKEGFQRKPFRVIRLSPSMNYQTVTVLAQVHDDDWYSDNPAVLGGAGRQPGSQVNTPRPLIGLVRSSNIPDIFDFQIREEIQTQPNGAATDKLTVGFYQPRKPSANSPSVPLVSLSAGQAATGGTLAGGSTFYYAVSAVDGMGNEGPLSFTVPVKIAAGTNTNEVTIAGLSFPAGATSFNVYRGTTPQMLYQISSGEPLAGSYLDHGATAQPIAPPDGSFDHANFYYRYEYAGPLLTTIFSSNSIGWESMGASPSAYVGMVVRIVEGSGRGQERSIRSNDATTLSVSPDWSVLPDGSSRYVIVEPSWRFAAVSATSPAQFEVSYRPGTVVQITGRGANVHDQEGSPELCPLTRWTLGGEHADGGIPGAPRFALAAPGGGNLELYDVVFDDLSNTSSISSGTLQLFHWNELNTPSPFVLATALDATGETVSLNSLPNDPPNSGVIQVGQELMTVRLVDAAAKTYTVERHALGSLAGGHDPGMAVRHLDSSFITVPFAANFFSNRASVNYIHTVSLPDIRVCAAEFVVTNAFGNSQSRQVCYAVEPEGELRTLSGGQFSMQVSGYLATQQNAAPPLIIEADHAVRDIRASVNQPAAGYDISIDIFQNGALFQNVTIPSGHATSDILTRLDLAPLRKEAALTINLTLNVKTDPPGPVSPGRDLTVTIRL
jgi:hypothetical protein